MTLTPYQPADVDPTGGRLVAWADGLAAAHRIGTALCETAFAPAAFRNKPGDAAAAILFGDEIGFTPTQALRSIFVVSGTPGLYARAMVALVLSKGHEVWTKASTDDTVTVCGKRANSERTEEVTWTAARARKAGYTSNKKYETDPQAMLYARAAADVCRRIAPDALAGISYTVEELELDQAATKPRTVRAPKVTAQVIVPEPDLEPEPTDVGAAPEAITPGQITKLHTMFSKVEIEGRDAALAWLTDETGREIESSKDLTKDEARRCIEALENLDRLNSLPEPPLSEAP